MVAARWAYPCSLLQLLLTVINAYFVWAAAARTVWPRRGAPNAHWLTRPSVTVCSGREGGGPRRLGTPSCGEALLVGGAPMQQARHAPACFALLIGCACRPISGTETRGKHRRVHVPFVHSGGGGEVGGERSGTGQPSVTDLDWVSCERAQRGGTVRLTWRNDPVQFRLIFAILKRRFYKHEVMRDVVTVRRGWW